VITYLHLDDAVGARSARYGLWEAVRHHAILDRREWRALPIAEDVEFDLTEAAGGCDLLGRYETSVAEDDAPLIVARLLDRGERCVVESLGRIDTADLSAGWDDPGGRNRAELARSHMVIGPGCSPAT
jgi:hypothetical protein